MYTISDDYKRDILASSRLFDIIIKIGENEYGSKDIFSLKNEGGVQSDESFTLGSVVSSSLTIEFKEEIDVDELEQVQAFIRLWVKNTTDEIAVYEWQDVPLGYYYVDEISVPKDGKQTIVCYDAMIKLEVNFEKPNMPETTFGIYKDIITQATGLEFDDESFPDDHTITDVNGTYTIRQIVGFMAAEMGGFATISRDEKITCVKPLSEKSIEIAGNNYYSFNKAKKEFKIGMITCFQGYSDDGSEIKTSTGTTAAGGKEIAYDSAFSTGEGRLSEILEEYESFSYYDYEIEVQGIPAIDSCDIVRVTGLDGTVYDLPVLWWSLTYDGGCKTTIKASSTTEVSSSFSSSSSSSSYDFDKTEQKIKNEQFEQYISDLQDKVYELTRIVNGLLAEPDAELLEIEADIELQEE